MKKQSLYFEAPYCMIVKEEPLREPGPGELQVRALVSAISAGTELLFYRGRVPPGMSVDETIPGLAGENKYPLKYGYAMVGEIIALGPGLEHALQNRLVFVFHPPESHFTISLREVQLLPDKVSAENAVFFPNMETAVTLAHDGKPIIGEQAAVFGQGVVGLLLTGLLAGQYPASLIAFDKHALRRRAALDMGAHFALDPVFPGSLDDALSLLRGSRTYRGADLCYEISGNPDALDQAIAVTGYNGRVIIGSWYGTKRVNPDLGSIFHRSRISLKSSQVSTIDPELSGRWNKVRLADTVWGMITKMNPARLITHRFHLSEAQAAYQLLDEAPERTIQVLLTY
jgi:2-desacetyl-2-hydroxyethyl bacteriochlorophyllide A dehydrogenase